MHSLALGEISTPITKGATPTTYGFEWQASGVPFLRSECVSEKGLDMRQSMFISSEAHASLQRSQVVEGDILLTITGNIGRVVQLEGIEEANINQHIARVRVIDDRLHPRYVFHYLSQRAVRQYYESITTGQAYPQISLAQVRSTAIPLISKIEQKEIVAALDDADMLISSLEHLISKKQAIKQGMMQELLRGKARLPGFTGAWRQEKLGSLSVMRSGGTPPSTNKNYYGGNVPWVSISDMTSKGKYIFETETTLTPEGLKNSAADLYEPDVVLYAMYASLGECSLAVGRVSSSQAILGISTKSELDREFLYHYLQFIKPNVKLMGQQGTQSNLNAGMVRNFDIPLPTIDEQLEIANVLNIADEEIQLLSRRLETVGNIKQGMMQELLTGRTRLPVEEVSS